MDRPENVVVFRFTEQALAYQALSELKQLGGSTVEVMGAMLVERQLDGTVRIPESVATRAGEGTLAGGLVGSVVGLLGGPLGVALGWGAGTLVGGGADWRQATESSGLVALVADEVSAGSTVLVAEVVERDTAAIDLLAMRFDAVLEQAGRAGASGGQGGPRGTGGGERRGRQGALGAEEGPAGSHGGGAWEGAQAAAPPPCRLIGHPSSRAGPRSWTWALLLVGVTSPSGGTGARKPPCPDLLYERGNTSSAPIGTSPGEETPRPQGPWRVIARIHGASDRFPPVPNGPPTGGGLPVTVGRRRGRAPRR